ncbi:hypothetical protein [Streptomyces yanii]|uniref:PE-PGRS family protein n=1 Tax=Streptomyces yanii TaxID=78510 RepID=A0ABV5R718_9ACTN
MFAAVCVLLTSLGHVLMSGTHVPWWAVVLGAAVTGATAWLFTAREHGLLPVLGASIAAQAVLHSAFSLAQAAVQPALPNGASILQRWADHVLCRNPPSEPVARAGLVNMALGHFLRTPPTGSVQAPPPSEYMSHDMAAMHSMSHTALLGRGSSVMSPGGMVAAHLLVALLGALWLAHGERAVFRILRAAPGWLVVPLRLPFVVPRPPHRPRMRTARDSSARTPREFLLAHAITSRGPPCGIAVL